jgi:hypothetical protein
MVIFHLPHAPFSLLFLFPYLPDQPEFGFELAFYRACWVWVLSSPPPTLRQHCVSSGSMAAEWRQHFGNMTASLRHHCRIITASWRHHDSNITAFVKPCLAWRLLVVACRLT